MEALGNLVSSYSILPEIVNGIQNILANGWGKEIIAILVVLTFVAFMDKTKIGEGAHILEELPSVVTMVITICGYILVESKIAPYTDIRYVMIVLPIIVLCVLKWGWDVGTSLLPNIKAVAALMFLSIVVIHGSSYCQKRVEYLFPNWSIEVNAVEPYYEYDAVVIADSGWKAVGSMVLHLKEHERSYIMKEARIEELPDLELSPKGVLLYIERDENLEENVKTIETLFNTNLETVYCGDYFQMYFCTLDT